MNKKIYLSSPHMSEEGYEREFVKNAFDTNWIAPLGPHVNEFENEIASYVGSKHAAALSSGTAAIHLALKAVGVGENDIVFCSDLTFAATCNPIIYQNAIPVFIDSDEETFNMNPIALKKAFEKYPNVKAVVAVNLYGQSADLDPILNLCNKYNVPLIEDAAESLGAIYKGKMSGTIGKIGIYSFNGNKIITTSGGGMLVSNDEEIVKKARFWATQSRDNERHYQHSELGYNYRMSNICAAIGRGQLKVLNKRIEKKTEIFNLYKKELEVIEDLYMMNICEYGKPNNWLSVLLTKQESKVKPLDIIHALEKENIESRPVWKPMHLQPFYEKYDFITQNEKNSISEDLFNRGVCLPSDTKMSYEEQKRVINIIKGLF